MDYDFEKSIYYDFENDYGPVSFEYICHVDKNDILDFVENTYGKEASKLVEDLELYESIWESFEFSSDLYDFLKERYEEEAESDFVELY